MFTIIYSTVMTMGSAVGGFVTLGAYGLYKDVMELKEQITELRCANQYLKGKEAGKKENETATEEK